MQSHFPGKADQALICIGPLLRFLVSLNPASTSLLPPRWTVSTSEQTLFPACSQTRATVGWNFSLGARHLAFTLILSPDSMNSQHPQGWMAAVTGGLREQVLLEEQPPMCLH